MPLLYYWRGDNYRNDLDMGAGFHLNQDNPLLHQIDIGDSLWAFTRRADRVYLLAAELVIRAKTMNPPNFRYGRYRVWGDLIRSRYFQTKGQPSIEGVIRHLSCRTEASYLGQSFQGRAAVRTITRQDHLILCAVANGLPPEPRARIFSEERLEAVLLLGDQETASRLILEEPAGVAEERRQYLYHQAPTRSRELVRELHAMYRGQCQLCRWNPKDTYGEFLCEGHHIQWLSRGGADHLENLVLLCPNHHTAVHRLDAPLDHGDLSFVFPRHREPIALNTHLK